MEPLGSIAQMDEIRHDAGVMAAVSGRVFLGLFLRVGILVGLFGGVGGLLALNSELTRASVSLPMSASIELFFLGLPEVLFHLLPLCAVVALIWTGAVLRESQTWMGMRLVGLGGRALWLSVVGFSALVGLGVGLLALESGERERAQRELLLREAHAIPWQAVQLGGVELHAMSGGLDDLSDVRVTSVSPPMHGAAETAVVEPKSGSLLLKNGVLVRESDPPMTIHFDTFSLELPNVSSGNPGVLKSSLEDRKRWSWPVMSVFLCVMVWPLSLQGRVAASLGSWLALWGLVRVCDHLLPVVGLPVAALLPPALLGMATLATWMRWEEA